MGKLEHDDRPDGWKYETEVAGSSDNRLPLPGAPEAIRINMPFELIRMAYTYPAIDWNAVMKYAVEAAQREGRL